MTVYELLKKYRWTHDGVTRNGRPRMKSPDGEVSVAIGPRTCYFYKQDRETDMKFWDSLQISTTDPEGLERVVRNVSTGRGLVS